MTTPPLSLPNLRAMAASCAEVAPGPWTPQWTGYGDGEARDDADIGIDYIDDANGDHVIVGDSGVYPPHGCVAEYIAAASPDVVLALVTRLQIADLMLEQSAEQPTVSIETHPRVLALVDRVAELESGLSDACDMLSISSPHRSDWRRPSSIARLRAILAAPRTPESK